MNTLFLLLVILIAPLFSPEAVELTKTEPTVSTCIFTVDYMNHVERKCILYESGGYIYVGYFSADGKRVVLVVQVDKNWNQKVIYESVELRSVAA